MLARSLLPGLAAASLLALAACGPDRGDGRAGNPPSTAVQRAYDRTTGSPTTPPDGTRGNPPATAAERAFDRAAGTNTSGAYPSQTDGTRANPPGTAVGRAVDRATR